MGTKDPRIDTYIATSAPFAQPILKRLRELIHAGCPGVEESIKWNCPHFMYHGMLCNMAAFKAHCTFGFWKARIMKTLGGKNKSEQAMGQYGRLMNLADLPSDKSILEQIKEAAQLNADGIQVQRPKSQRKKPLKIPPYFTAALKGNPKAFTTFQNSSPSHQREYVEWITEAKTEATRQKRLGTALQWLAEGKNRNWKYENC
jgi:uncharacterized protein YdeI (YjbR/CyaY-like superfamily)